MPSKAKADDDSENENEKMFYKLTDTEKLGALFGMLTLVLKYVGEIQDQIEDMQTALEDRAGDAS